MVDKREGVCVCVLRVVVVVVVFVVWFDCDVFSVGYKARVGPVV